MILKKVKNIFVHEFIIGKDKVKTAQATSWNHQAVHCSVTASSDSRDAVLSDRSTIIEQFRLILISQQKSDVINDVFQSSE